MALYPCDVNQHRYRGRGSMAYVALVDGVASNRWKLRLCPEHVRSAIQDLKPFEVYEGETADEIFERDRPCILCGRQVMENGQQLFVTCYEAGQDRRDFWALTHIQCGAPKSLPYKPVSIG